MTSKFIPDLSLALRYVVEVGGESSDYVVDLELSPQENLQALRDNLALLLGEENIVYSGGEHIWMKLPNGSVFRTEEI